MQITELINKSTKRLNDTLAEKVPTTPPSIKNTGWGGSVVTPVRFQ